MIVACDGKTREGILAIVSSGDTQLTIITMHNIIVCINFASDLQAGLKPKTSLQFN